MSLRHRKNFFTRTQIIKEELHRISQDVATVGRTPPQTLSRVLQELRKEGFLEFDGHGRYTLLTSTSEPVTSDIPHQYASPDRTPTTVHRIVRDVGIVGELKRLYGYRCQMCGTRLELSSGFYCEAHHLKPLGAPHNGPDAKANIILVCPNHHVLLDYRAMRIDIGTLHVNHHLVSNEFVNYHNQYICGNAEQSAAPDRQ
jgi:predicted restriction endonuclease